jgi:predicted alpha/beta superfamily hydrolase
MRFFVLLIWVFSFDAFAQVTIRIESLPVSTPPDSRLYVAGNFNGWNPADTTVQFKKNGTYYEVTLPIQLHPILYKITRGSWASCEVSITGESIENRQLDARYPLTVGISIAGWGNQKNSTALQNVTLLSDSFWMPQLQKYRRIWVYLPTNYDKKSLERYPVLYMHDGQNIFDERIAFSGEWGVDETLNTKEKKGNKGCIVVAVDNGGVSRLDEYSPYVNAQYGGGQGRAYVDFLTLTLKPFIDSAYHTHSDPFHTAIVGSSMGAFISIYAAVRYPDVYGKVGVFSPSLQFSDSLYSFIQAQFKTGTTQFYIVAGAKESEQMVPMIDQLVKLLLSKGYPNEAIVKVIRQDGEHKEWFWKEMFAPFYGWLGY